MYRLTTRTAHAIRSAREPPTSGNEPRICAARAMTRRNGSSHNAKRNASIKVAAMTRRMRSHGRKAKNLPSRFICHLNKSLFGELLKQLQQVALAPLRFYVVLTHNRIAYCAHGRWCLDQAPDAGTDRIQAIVNPVLQAQDGRFTRQIAGNLVFRGHDYCSRR